MFSQFGLNLRQLRYSNIWTFVQGAAAGARRTRTVRSLSNIVKSSQVEYLHCYRKSKEMARLSEMEGVESLAVVEAAASRAITTEKALQAAPVQTSWWPKMSLWSSAAAPTSQAIPPIAEPKEKVERNSRAYNPGETRPKPDHN